MGLLRALDNDHGLDAAGDLRLAQHQPSGVTFIVVYGSVLPRCLDPVDRLSAEKFLIDVLSLDIDAAAVTLVSEARPK